MRTINAVVLLVALLLVTGSATLSAQAPPEDWDPARLHVSRDEMVDLLERYEAVAASSGYSNRVRDRARQNAERIRQRLERGDFRVGDRIALGVEGLGGEEIPDTLVVEPGPSVVIEQMGTISLHGVLRSELEEHMTQQLRRYIQDPIVHAQSLIRLSVQGAVGSPGFYVFPSDMLLQDVLMSAGAPARDADLEDISVRRGSETVLEGEEVRIALDEGRSLDQLDLRAGDEIQVPADEPNVIASRLFRYGMIIASSLLLGIRIF